MGVKADLVIQICCGLETFLIASVSSLYIRTCLCVHIVTGVTVTVNKSTSYVVNEPDGVINITLLLDQTSCRPITIIAHPQARSVPNATGIALYHTYILLMHVRMEYFVLVDDFDDTSVTVIIDPEQTSATVSIPIIDDELLENTEFFDVVIEIGGSDTDGAIVGQPGVAEVAIISEDG